jgi:hypothetical protein
MVLLNNHDAFVKVRWTSYGGSRARANGTLGLTTCVPSCAEGRYWTYLARATLDRVKTCSGRRFYSRIRVRYRSGDRWRRLAASRGGLAAPC